MKIIVAPDSFKGSLSAIQVSEQITKGINHVSPGNNIHCFPMADGGEGTVETIIRAKNGKKVKVVAHDPLKRKINCEFGLIDEGHTAIIEMASASGLVLLKSGERDPMYTTTYGTGELIKSALDYGCTKIIVGLGGSSTTDAGAGMVQALGGRLLDKNKKQVKTGGAFLKNINKIDLSQLDKRLEKCEILAACDVKNPLYGPDGAAYVYSPQKGANPEEVKILDNNLKHFSDVILKELNLDVSNIERAGAAGGLGAGLYAFLSAKIVNGFELIKDIVNLEQAIKESDIIIAGEGKIDKTSMSGKAPYGIAKICRKYNKPVIALTGSVDFDYDLLTDSIFDCVVPITDKPMDEHESIKNVKILTENAAKRIMQLIKITSN